MKAERLRWVGRTDLDRRGQGMLRTQSWVQTHGGGRASPNLLQCRVLYFVANLEWGSPPRGWSPSLCKNISSSVDIGMQEALPDLVRVSPVSSCTILKDPASPILSDHRCKPIGPVEVAIEGSLSPPTPGGRAPLQFCYNLEYLKRILCLVP